MNEQRKFIYAIRNRILHEANLTSLLQKWVKDTVVARVDQFLTDVHIADEPLKVEEDFNTFKVECKKVYEIIAHENEPYAKVLYSRE